MNNIAKGLGVKIEKERVVLFFIAVVLSSIAVAVAGAIAFIGLMGPHIAKNQLLGHVINSFYQFHYRRCFLTRFIRYYW